MRRENAMLKLGTRVEYANQRGRIIGRTIELQPKYDVMLANGTVRSNVREGDLIILSQPDLGTGNQSANSIEDEPTAQEARNANTDRRG
jgi:hypothetical protein